MSIDDVLVGTRVVVHVVLARRSGCKGNVGPEVAEQPVPVSAQAVSLAVQLLHGLVALFVHVGSLDALNTLVGKVDGLQRVVPAVLNVGELHHVDTPHTAAIAFFGVLLVNPTHFHVGILHPVGAHARCVSVFAEIGIDMVYHLACIGRVRAQVFKIVG